MPHHHRGAGFHRHGHFGPAFVGPRFFGPSFRSRHRRHGLSATTTLLLLGASAAVAYGAYTYIQHRKRQQQIVLVNGQQRAVWVDVPCDANTPGAMQVLVDQHGNPAPNQPYGYVPPAAPPAGYAPPQPQPVAYPTATVAPPPGYPSAGAPAVQPAVGYPTQSGYPSAPPAPPSAFYYPPPGTYQQQYSSAPAI